MVITPHMVAATLIAVNFEKMHVSKPFRYPKGIILPAAFLAAFGSHFLVDFIPHHDYSIYSHNRMDNFAKLAMDTAVGLALLSFVFKQKLRDLADWGFTPISAHNTPSATEKLLGLPSLLTTLLCVFASLLPDIFIVLLRSNGMSTRFQTFHRFFHSTLEPGVFLGVFTQIVFVIGAYTLTHYSHRKLCKEGLRLHKFRKFLAEINGDEELCPNRKEKR